MKKTLLILIILFTSLLLTSCTEEEVDNNHLIKDPITTWEISQIDIEVGDFKKSFIDDNNIRLVADYLNRIQILDEAQPINQDEDSIRIKIYDSNRDIMEGITIGRGLVNYNKTWYPIDPNIYDDITEFYQALDSEAVENQLVIDIKGRQANRAELPLEESIKGSWVSIDGSIIKFEGDILTQGDQTKNNFGYSIDSINNNQMEITVFGLEGIFLGARDLSTLEIMLDPTNSLMKMRRTMIGGRVSDDKLIYVDNDGLELGFFDSYFFFEGL